MFQNILRRAHNLPIVNLTVKIIILCRTNNFQQHSAEDIADDVLILIIFATIDRKALCDLSGPLILTSTFFVLRS